MFQAPGLPSAVTLHATGCRRELDCPCERAPGRRPSARAVGAGEFYVARDQRTSCPSEPCLAFCVTAEHAPTIFSMGAGHSPRACGGSLAFATRGESMASPAPLPTLRPRPADKNLGDSLAPPATTGRSASGHAIQRNTDCVRDFVSTPVADPNRDRSRREATP